MINRRNTLKALGLTAVGVGSCLSRQWMVLAQDSDPFPNPLKIPTLLEGNGVAGVKQILLRLQAGTTDFFTGISTDTRGINQSFLGPTIRFRDGDAVAMSVTNSLDELTTIHWHGLHRGENYGDI